MRYSSTLIGMGMRYSLISMVVLDFGRLRVCECVCVQRGRSVKRVDAPLGFATRAACSNGEDGSHYSHLREETRKQTFRGINMKRKGNRICRLLTNQRRSQSACLSQGLNPPYTSQHFLCVCVSSSPPTDLLQGNPLT